MQRDVVEARWLGGYRIHLRFEDGVEGEVDLADMIDFEGVFEPLTDPVELAKVRVDRELGTIVWASGGDLDPLVLYSKVTGTPIDVHLPTAITEDRGE